MYWTLVDFEEIGIPNYYTVDYTDYITREEFDYDEYDMYFAAVALQELYQEYTIFNIDTELDLVKETRDIYLNKDFGVSRDITEDLKNLDDYLMLCYAYKQLTEGEFSPQFVVQLHGYSVKIELVNSIYSIANEGQLPTPKPDDISCYIMFLELVEWYLRNLNEGF